MPAMDIFVVSIHPRPNRPSADTTDSIVASPDRQNRCPQAGCPRLWTRLDHGRGRSTGAQRSRPRGGEGVTEILLKWCQKSAGKYLYALVVPCTNRWHSSLFSCETLIMSVLPLLISLPLLTAVAASTCGSGTLDATNLRGDIVLSGESNQQPSAPACCQSCQAAPSCDVWVYCGMTTGCDNGFGVVFPFQQCWLKNRGLSAQPRPWIGASPTTFTSGYLDARPAAAPTSSPGQVPVPGLRDDARPLLRSLPSGQTRVLVVCASGQQQKAVDLATSLGAPATWTVQAVKALVPASGTVDAHVVINDTGAWESLRETGIGAVQVVNGSVVVVGDGIKLLSEGVGLQDMTGFGPTRIQGDLVIKDTALETLQGMGSLTSVAGDFIAAQNVALRTFQGLSPALQVGGSVALVGFNWKIKNLDSVPFSNRVPGSVSIQGLIALTSLATMSDVHEVGGSLTVAFCPGLRTLGGLANLVAVRGNLSVSNNDSITSLDGLGRLQIVNGDLTIAGDPLLADLTALQALQSVMGRLVLRDNPSITSIPRALANIMAAAAQGH